MLSWRLEVGRASGEYFSRGQSPWIGFKYRFKGKDSAGTAINEEMSLVAPLTSEHGLMAAPCAFAWLLLLVSAVAHAMRYCTTDECDSSDDDEPSTMYS